MSKAEKAAAYKRWRLANKEYVYARNKAWVRANYAKRLKAIRRWGEENPEKIREYKRKSAANQYARPEVAILVRLRSRLSRNVRNANPRCLDHDAVHFLLWCRPHNLTDFHIDHIFPLSSPLGAKLGNIPENVRWLPARENLRKSDYFPTQNEVDEHMMLVAAWTASK